MNAGEATHKYAAPRGFRTYASAHMLACMEDMEDFILAKAFRSK